MTPWQLPPILAHLLADNPSVQAAMKAGRRTSISVKIIRANGAVEDYGVVTSNETSWRAALARMLGTGRVVIRFVWRGKEIERSTY